MAHDDDSTKPPSDQTLRIKALESLLVEKGLVDPAAIDEIIETFEHKLGPRNGASVVARAWVDEEFKARLLQDGTRTIAELGFQGMEGSEIIALENTPEIHNVIVCTLCSCYPWPVLGLPPTWYKSPQYRSRVVIEPRAVLREFGLAISNDVEVRVWDSNAEIRYIVIPMRPAGTENWTEGELAKLVSRNAMIGTDIASLPERLS